MTLENLLTMSPGFFCDDNNTEWTEFRKVDDDIQN